jgi:SAM-dependent methyltransferase
MASEASTQLLDLARYALEVERLTHRIQLHHADEERPFPFPDGYFDTIVAHLALHRVDRPQEWIAEAIRCLQPGGSLLLRDWLPGDLAGDGSQLPDLWQAMMPWRNDPMVKQSIWSFDEITAWPLPEETSWEQMERGPVGVVWSGVIRKNGPQYVA